MAPVTTRSEIDEIRRRMAQIRHELHEDMQEVVSGAEGAIEWRRYVRRYPWVAVSLAAALGYLIVPKRRKVVVEAKQAVGELRKVAAVEAEKVQAKTRRKGWVRTALGLLTPLLVRAGQRYAINLAEGLLTHHAGPRPESAPGTVSETSRDAGPTDSAGGGRRA